MIRKHPPTIGWLSFTTVLAVPAAASACAVCSTGGENTQLVEAANAAVLVMIGFVAAVLTGVASVAGFWYLRARRAMPPSETIA